MVATLAEAGGGHGDGRVARRRPRNGRVPAGRPPRRRRPLVALVAGGRRAPATPPWPPITPPWWTPSWPWPRPRARPAGSPRRSATADVLLERFWDAEQGGLFTTADDGEALIVRQKDLLDNATPSANSLAAVGLYRLGALTGEARYRNHADQILRLAGRGDAGAARPSPTSSPPSTCVAPASPRSPSSAIDPTWWPSCSSRYLPDAVPGVGRAATTHRCGSTGRTGWPTSATTTCARHR